MAVEPLRAISDMTPQEVQEAFEAGGDLVVIPIGAVDGAACSGPLGALKAAAQAWAGRVVRGLRERGLPALLGPAIPFGFNPSSMSYPGTIHLRPETLMGLIVDVCRSLGHHGLCRQVLLCTHEDSWPIVQLACRQLTEEIPGEIVALRPAQGPVSPEDPGPWGPAAPGLAGPRLTAPGLAAPGLLYSPVADLRWVRAGLGQGPVGCGLPEGLVEWSVEVLVTRLGQHGKIHGL